jgi:hypothetical protein
MLQKHGYSKERLFKNLKKKKKILRRIFAPTKEKDGTWRIKTNKEFDR